ncbi:MAG TPA: arsenosugar biosynthesis radical SAM (seleno)protein ArsS [Planctomycetota bacterium]|nr:arsenosugar biosynthesis radical SAM (seleno)protein ArsS [Planctomycetota bacterium]
MRRGRLATLQLNLGRHCNIACAHCHVESSPARTERMSAAVRERVIAWIREHRPRTVDLTGGAPELIPGFRELVAAARAAGCVVMDRCNLAVLDEPGQQDLAAFLAEHRVVVVASMPCYLQENVDKQRGRGTYTRSIAGLRQLNAHGYGHRPELPLHLVYNPGGPSLPPEQQALQASYKERLLADWGVHFHELWCLTNVPITRFRQSLQRTGQLESYEDLLWRSFNATTLDHLMCRSTLSVDHEGRLYDCDFNLALDLPLGGVDDGRRLWHVRPADVEQGPVPMASHCLACTAGCGSSCTGTLVN